MKTLEDLSQPLDDAEYDELDAFLLSLEHENAVWNLSELDGLVTAIVSGPEPVAPSEWLPVVWGGADEAPALESPEAFERMIGLMVRHLNSTVHTLMEDPLSYEPCFMENQVKGKTYRVVDDWCVGYMKGVGLREELWLNSGEDLIELLSPIPLFTTQEGWDLLDQLADRHVEYLQSQVAVAARAIHAFWLNQRNEFLPPEGAILH